MSIKKISKVQPELFEFTNENLIKAEKESEKIIVEKTEKFHKIMELRKKNAEQKILQMKEAALKEIKDNSVRLTMESVKKIISTSIDKSKLDTLFQKNLEE